MSITLEQVEAKLLEVLQGAMPEASSGNSAADAIHGLPDSLPAGVDLRHSQYMQEFRQAAVRTSLNYDLAFEFLDLLGRALDMVPLLAGVAGRGSVVDARAAAIGQVAQAAGGGGSGGSCLAQLLGQLRAR